MITLYSICLYYDFEALKDRICLSALAKSPRAFAAPSRFLRHICMWGGIAFVFVAARSDNATVYCAEMLAPDRADRDTIDILGMQRACGARSLLIWLRLLGYKVGYEEVLECVPIGERGTTLAQLGKGAHHWTTDAKLLKASPGDLDWLRLPAIAHGSVDAVSGHYVVVVNVTPHSIAYLDSSQGIMEEMSRSTFENNFWSGYVLVIESPADKLSRYLALAVVSCVAIIGFCLFRRSKLRATALALLITCGCDNGTHSVAIQRPVNPATADAPLAVSGSKKDLGTVRLGESARAVFTLSNVSGTTISLSLGRPSCGCLESGLSQDHLEPDETAELTLILSRGRDGLAGKLSGTNAVGIAERDNQLFFFEATAIVEGMRVDRYSLRIPANPSTFSPEPIRGEIHLGPERQDAKVQIVDVVLRGDGDNQIKLGTPALAETETLTSHLRRRFQIPVTVVAAHALVSRAYEVQITYRIDDQTADYYLPLLIFPEAIIPH